MKEAELSRFRTLIEHRLREIQREDLATRADRAAVELDQQSVGRLSRMDAMQQQAMAAATHRRRQQETAILKAALGRMASGEFGFCETCGDLISPKRLEFNPGATRCIGCMPG